MKTIDLIISGKRSTIFVDRICFILERNSTEVYISFSENNMVTAKISYNELIEKISKL